MLFMLQREFFAQALFAEEGVQFDCKSGRANELHVLVSIASALHDEAREKLEDALDRICLQARERVGVTMTIGVGALYATLLDVPQSFSEAKAAYRHKIVAGTGRIIWSHTLLPQRVSPTHYPFRAAKQIFQALKRADTTETERAVDGFFAEIQDSISSPRRLRYLAVQLFNDAMRLLQESSIDSVQVFPDSDAMYDEVLALETMEEAREYFSKMFAQIAFYIEKQKRAGSEDVSQIALRYINEHFMEENLSLETLSEQLHFSVSYLVRVFKHSIGKSIKEHITEKRIEAAKELLQDGKMKIVDIARRVGYPNVRSFINIFKKYTGETPGQYKANSRNQA